MITHRLSAITDAEQTLVLDHGRLIERGTHAQLLETGGAYAQMWRRQQAHPEEVGSPSPAKSGVGDYSANVVRIV